MSRPSRKPRKRVTPQRLRNIALAYVQRYGGSSRRLTQVLVARVDRSLRYHEELDRRPEALAWISTLVEELRGLGISDDDRHARALAIEQALQGRPRRIIRMRLRAKGFEDHSIEGALAALDGEADPDWVACCRYARRRGLGPFGASRRQPRTREQELAALMRAGFGYALARRVVEAESTEPLEAVITEAPVPRL